jgi:hypothetical protein
MVKPIKPLENYAGVADGELVARATNIKTNMTGNANFANPRVDLAIFKTDIDTFSALIAEAQDGSKKIIAEKNKQRDVIVRKLRLLGRYVEFACNDDMTIFKSGGFPCCDDNQDAVAGPVPEHPPHRSLRQQRPDRRPAEGCSESSQLRTALRRGRQRHCRPVVDDRAGDQRKNARHFERSDTGDDVRVPGPLAW